MRFTAFVCLAFCCSLAAVATPVNFATYLGTDADQSQFASPSDQRTTNTANTSQIAQANLSQGALRTLNQRTGGFGGLATQALFYDTITFDQSAFEGSFGASYNLNLNALYEGSFTSSGTIISGGTGGRIHVYSGATVIDSSVFADSNSLINFLFIGGPAPVCAQGVNGPDLTTHQGPFSFNVGCSVTVNAANPTVRIIMNLPTFINANTASWTLDMMNTATLDLGNLGGRKVYSASGALPGTQPSPVPEPSTFGLAAAGLAVAFLRRRK